MKSACFCPFTSAALATLILGFGGSASAQTLETETARLVPKGGVELGFNFEHQRSSEGSETAIPLAFIVGLGRRFELMVEPVAFTAIRPKLGPRATGVGDIETTLTYLAAGESRGRPAIALAGEVKFPSARTAICWRT